MYLKHIEKRLLFVRFASIYNYILFFVYPCRFLRVVTTVVIVVYVFIEVVLEHPENLISVLGLIVTILIFFVTSKAPEKVNTLVKQVKPTPPRKPYFPIGLI